MAVIKCNTIEQLENVFKKLKEEKQDVVYRIIERIS